MVPFKLIFTSNTKQNNQGKSYMQLLGVLQVMGLQCVIFHYINVWCGIFHYHWWAASIKPRLLFSHSGLVSRGLPFLQFNIGPRNGRFRVRPLSLRPLANNEYNVNCCFISFCWRYFPLFNAIKLNHFVNMEHADRNNRCG